MKIQTANLTFEQFTSLIFKIEDKVNNIERILLLKNNYSLPPPPIEKEFLDMDEAASLLHISKSTLFGKTSRNEIKYFKRGKKNLFRKSDLMEYLNNGKVDTINETEEKINQSILGK